jgi:hypothetical protein
VGSNALKESLERYIAMLEDECESQNKAQQMEQERLQKHWQKRLARWSNSSPESVPSRPQRATICKECNVAMTPVHSHPNMPCFSSNSLQSHLLMIILLLGILD